MSTYRPFGSWAISGRFPYAHIASYDSETGRWRSMARVINDGTEDDERLIASAPRLLAALQELADGCAIMEQGTRAPDYRLLEEAYAALAAALGQEVTS